MSGLWTRLAISSEDAREINDQLRVVAVLNAADAQGKDNEEAATIIREKVGFEYFPYPIVRRKAFRNAAAAGLSVLEMHPRDEKAISEFSLLASYVLGYASDIALVSHANRKESLSQDNDERQESREVHSSRSRARVGPGRRRGASFRRRSGFRRACWLASIKRRKGEA